MEGIGGLVFIIEFVDCDLLNSLELINPA